MSVTPPSSGRTCKAGDQGAGQGVAQALAWAICMLGAPMGSRPPGPSIGPPPLPKSPGIMPPRPNPPLPGPGPHHQATSKGHMRQGGNGIRQTSATNRKRRAVSEADVAVLGPPGEPTPSTAAAVGQRSACCKPRASTATWQGRSRACRVERASTRAGARTAKHAAAAHGPAREAVAAAAGHAERGSPHHAPRARPRSPLPGPPAGRRATAHAAAPVAAGGPLAGALAVPPLAPRLPGPPGALLPVAARPAASLGAWFGRVGERDQHAPQARVVLHLVERAERPARGGPNPQKTLLTPTKTLNHCKHI